jgi:hypothetical protein
MTSGSPGGAPGEISLKNSLNNFTTLAATVLWRPPNGDTFVTSRWGSGRCRLIVVWAAIWFYIARMSSVAEIEAAVDRLPSAEQARLLERLLERAATKPKTGAELAAIWPACFHLTAQEAEEFARDLEGARQSPPKALVWE